MEDGGGSRLGDTAQRARAHRLAAGTGVLLACVVGLMTLGALVRAHEAGLACPDWPLCFGELVPRINLEVGFEWSHRVLAGAISLAFVGLAGTALRTPGTRAVAAPWLAAAAALLAMQILLGALTVWALLAPWTVTSHLLAANAFAVTLLWMAMRLREAGGGSGPVRVDGATRALLAATAAAWALQVALGGLVSSTFAGMVCPEWPTCNGGYWFPSWRGTVGLHLAHRTNGYLLVALLGATAWRCRGVPRLARVAGLALVLGAVQVAVGVANVLLAIPVEVTGLHSLLAALLSLATAATLGRVRWRGAAAR